ncbi:MAG: septum formation initiator family protein [Alphaproteobacteria bacterium]|nr:MAG: septum formation initiator family protein [Alphaproteobacteria bacterium]
MRMLRPIALHLRSAVLPAVLATLIAYFAHFALGANGGWRSWRELAVRQAELERTYAHLHDERLRLERRVALLDPRSLDPDMLDEMTRRLLGYAGRDDLIILMPHQEQGGRNFRHDP